MKTIGLVGGVSWESSAEYYRLINQEVKAKLGVEHSAELLMYSLNFHPIIQLEHEERWDDIADLLINVVQKIEQAGADFFLIASNTLHKVASAVQNNVGIPLVHIADATAEKIVESGVSSVGLLGTRFVMEQDFYKERFASYGISVVVPSPESMNYIHHVIYKELCLGKIRETSRQKLLSIIDNLQEAGATAIVLGNTELPLLIRPQDTIAKLFDTMLLHVQKAVAMALEVT
ncbi:aspartate/glutamate racemase family protein [Chlorogloeopsis sp. ULAP01]|uniref:aspartate/glutamate racemase family protein n=1 Tax=Chlorogloeopsis sp. ULAP01 TaxID=3056483 RepID=UPI0025AB4BF4|nr:aspartate/glutamate racemase family protein [Chlorogloeopsis sp. ULAP01]MDM9383042.1 aspartate/glutamate racemase family protein [Chlorogloeopsis sp. ULAP01]